jgi:hypothetical protein
MTMTGGCQCGAIRYAAEGEAEHHALCHCADCRASSGAPMTGWIAFKTDQVAISGEPTVFASSEHGRRSFCGTCGTGLFYRNEAALPGLTDIQSATLDDAAAHAPQAQIQAAERLPWTAELQAMPAFDRYPGM